jgi:hypothetical protein
MDFMARSYSRKEASLKTCQAPLTGDGQPALIVAQIEIALDVPEMIACQPRLTRECPGARCPTRLPLE